MTNRKSHTPFRLAPKSTTLGDLERPIRTLLQKNWMKIDPHYQLQKCRPMTLVSGDIRFMRIFAGVLWRRGVKRQWGNRKRRFSGFWTLRLRHLRKWGQHYYMLLFSPLSPFQLPQNILPWMTLTGYLALNSVFASIWMVETARFRRTIAWKLIKTDTYRQLCKSSTGTLVSGNVIKTIYRYLADLGAPLRQDFRIGTSFFAKYKDGSP